MRGGAVDSMKLRRGWRPEREIDWSPWSVGSRGRKRTQARGRAAVDSDRVGLGTRPAAAARWWWRRVLQEEEKLRGEGNRVRRDLEWRREREGVEWKGKEEEEKERIVYFICTGVGVGVGQSALPLPLPSPHLRSAALLRVWAPHAFPFHSFSLCLSFLFFFYLQ